MGWHAQVSGTRVLQALNARNKRLGWPEHHLYLIALASSVDDGALQFLSDYATELDALTGQRVLFITFYNEAWLPVYTQFGSGVGGREEVPLLAEELFDIPGSLWFYTKVPVTMTRVRGSRFTDPYADEVYAVSAGDSLGTLSQRKSYFARSMTYESYQLCRDLGFSTGHLPCILAVSSLDRSNGWVLSLEEGKPAFRALREVMGRIFQETRRSSYYQRMDEVHGLRQTLHALNAAISFVREIIVTLSAPRFQLHPLVTATPPTLRDPDLHAQLLSVQETLRHISDGRERVWLSRYSEHAAGSKKLQRHLLNLRLWRDALSEMTRWTPQLTRELLHKSNQLPNWLRAPSGRPLKIELNEAVKSGRIGGLDQLLSAGALQLGARVSRPTRVHEQDLDHFLSSVEDLGRRLVQQRDMAAEAFQLSRDTFAGLAAPNVIERTLEQADEFAPVSFSRPAGAACSLSMADSGRLVDPQDLPPISKHYYWRFAESPRSGNAEHRGTSTPVAPVSDVPEREKLMDALIQLDYLGERSRQLLLYGLPSKYIAKMPIQASPYDQALSDITELLKTRSTSSPDNQSPIEVWLTNALSVAKQRNHPAMKVFAESLDQARRLRAGLLLD